MTPSNMFVPAIESFLSDYKEKDERDPKKITMSSIGHCARQLAYRHHGMKGEPLSWRSKIIFQDGNLHHMTVRAWLAKALAAKLPCFSLIMEEAKVSLEHGNKLLEGHVDGMLAHSRTCSVAGHEDMLLEVKSMNTRAFSEFTNGNVDPSYKAQIYAYLRGTGLATALIIAKNKDNGKMAEAIIKMDNHVLDERLNILSSIYYSSDPTEIPKEHEPKKGNYLPWQCGYCPYVNECWTSRESYPKLISEHVYRLVPTTL